jgi:hypothetical protein
MVETVIRIVKITSTKEGIEVIVNNRPRKSRIRRLGITMERHDTLRRLVRKKVCDLEQKIKRLDSRQLTNQPITHSKQQRLL